MTSLPFTFRGRSSGFTLLELMIVVAIITILATIGVPIYQRTKANAEDMNALAEIRNISGAVDRFILVNGHPPDALAEVAMDHMRDEWGNPYQYARVDNIGKNGKNPLGQRSRKDHNLHPLNSDYDLCSMGPDGKTSVPLTAQASQDDIIRAQDGDFFGRASEY